jgi:pilus assembly protein CpaF
MYAVVITDDGGVRRRLDFEKPELTLGRVQGNDIVLSKRNVSKQHARLTLSGEQPVVVDLNSTNGTWVNGRKISSPQPLKQGDKIYIADFIITLEPGGDEPSQVSAVPSVSEPPPLPERPATPVHSSMPIRRSIAKHRSFVGNPEGDDDEPRPTSLPPRYSRRDSGEGRPRAKTDPGVLAADPLSELLYRLAERIDVENIDAAAMKNQDRWSAARAAIAETFLAMQTEGSVNAELDIRQIAHTALHEAVGLGALDDVLNDDSVRAVIVSGPERVLVDKGKGPERASLSFSSEAALRNVARRLASASGQVLGAQPVLHGLLSFGPRVTIMQPPLTASGMVIELRIPSTRSLEQLAEGGWLSTEASTYLTKAVAECRNIVVVGPRDSGVSELMSALARELPEGESAVAIEAVPDLSIDRDRIISLTSADAGISHAEAVEQGARLRPQRLIISDLGGADVMASLSSVLGQEPGHLLSVHCWSGKGAIEGLIVAACSGGADREAVAQLVSSAVDIVVSMERGPEGARVGGVLEIQGHEGRDVSYQAVPF